MPGHGGRGAAGDDLGQGGDDLAAGGIEGDLGLGGLRIVEQQRDQDERHPPIEGRQEAHRVWVARILTARFGPLPDKLQERIVSATSAELERWAETVLTAETLDALLGE